MDQAKRDELQKIANALKGMLPQTSPGPWTAHQEGAPAGYAGQVRVGDRPVLDVCRTDPGSQAEANAGFVVFAHENTMKLAKGVLELLKELDAAELKIHVLEGEATRKLQLGRGT